MYSVNVPKHLLYEVDRNHLECLVISTLLQNKHLLVKLVKNLLFLAVIPMSWQ